MARNYFPGASVNVMVTNSAMPTNPVVGSVNNVVYTIVNSGNVPTNGITVGAFTSPLTLVSNTCGITLAAGVGCQIVVSIDPLVTGSQSGNVPITYNDGTSHTVSLNWNTTAIAATLSVSPRYNAAPNWNDYVRYDGADKFSASNTLEHSERQSREAVE